MLQGNLRPAGERRGTIWMNCQDFVQDDSGIPYRYFDRGNWDLRLYGKYSDPIQLFKNWRQDDLKAAFEAQTEKLPLDFGIGYHRSGESNLLVAGRGNTARPIKAN